ncbi:hypothetical protein AGABI2DRAFT_115192 [Agaricus bisporus var. bisporus H97]|uniref:hypothetical protein n=1 Tax=Agaricus bisporus var. bisporus (strain H97 / ATCC MYA-4626 / FGSC 10389) TaxID=936046 RepID=UPI00029F5CCB|nr:hypothetical protein AGABI2DRAFT_115192 [Agaricus bisporus var. bisporus H97]EKV50136.1 hypothetical protein AGABI2DRAFT_115192 [Agaricus bisporus var. bisporus H97]
MNTFQPTRASPPLRSNRKSKTSSVPPSIADTRSIISNSTVVVPELRNLAQDDLDFIESVIQHAGPMATTFPVVFKAYNNVLKERGMDTGEIRYYGKLLKIGTMKGKNWGEKWEAVKTQQIQETVSLRVKPRSNTITHDIRFPPLRLQDIDAETIPSDTGDDNALTKVPHYHKTPSLSVRKHQVLPKPSQKRNLAAGVPIVPSTRDSSTPIRRILPPDDTSVSEAETIAPSMADVHDKASRRYHREFRSNVSGATRTLGLPQTPARNNRFSGARLGVMQSRGQPETDEDDAWNKIRVQQLEAEADRLREGKMLERCWHVWTKSYQWIVTSQDQIDEARHAFLLRLAFHHWKNAYAFQDAKNKRALVLDDERRLWAFFEQWKKRSREKQQVKWRHDMRNKMKIIKDRHNLRILVDTWMLWHQKHQIRSAGEQYNQRVLLLAFLKWKESFRKMDMIEGKAEQLVILRDQRLLLRVWETWRAATRISSIEKGVVDRAHARIMWNTWMTWKKHTYDYRRATFFRVRSLQKGTTIKWRNALQNVQALVVRADKHAARQDKIFACAVLEVWLAHVRSREVDRQRDKKIMYQSWLIWKRCMIQNMKRNGSAIDFYNRTGLRVVSASASRWKAVYQSHRSTYEGAIIFYDNRICGKSWTAWVSRFREGLEERKRQKLVRKLHDRQAARVLYRWLLSTRQRRRCRQTELLVQERVNQRLGQGVLAHWTERVIFMRERELHAIEAYSMKVESDAWIRFKLAHTRHQENIKLLDDHLALKREDTLSRHFHRWLANTRVTQHRRYILQSKEDEMKLMMTQKAWERWNSSFLERRLRPLEIEMLMRSQQNLMYQAFSVWHTKAKTRPAIVAVKFSARHTKKKFYLKWRDALPIAQKARRVREKHDNLILSRVFKQWLEAYRAKLVMKAMARARYLRLPASGRTGLGQAPTTTSFPSSSAPPSVSHAPTATLAAKSCPTRPGISYLPSPGGAKLSLTEATIVGGSEVDKNTPGSDGSRPRLSRLPRSPFGLGQGTGIVSLLRTNVIQESDLSPPRPRRYQFLNARNHRKANPNESENRSAEGPSFFTSVNAESTPPSRRGRSTASDDVVTRRIPWNQLRIGRREREPSPSTASHLTVSPPASP